MPASRIFTWAFSSAVSTWSRLLRDSVNGQATQAVVAAELHDHDCRMQAQNERQPGQRILGRRAARSLVDYLVRIALRIQLLLQKVGIRLTVGETTPGGNAVAVADEDRPISFLLAAFCGGHQASQPQESAERVRQEPIVERPRIRV